MLTLLGGRWRCIKCGSINVSSGAGGGPVGCDGHEGGGGDDCSVEDHGQTIYSPQHQNGVSSICVQTMPVITSLETLLSSHHQEQKTLTGHNVSTPKNTGHVISVTGRDSDSGVLVTSL